MSSRVFIAALSLVFTVAGSIAVAGVRGAPRGSPPTMAPSAGSDIVPRPATAEPREAAVDGFLGVIMPRVSSSVAPRFEGRLKSVEVRLGDHVAAGTVIAALDVPSLRFDLQAAEASLAVAKVDEARALVELREAEERLSRRTTLAADRLTTAEDLATAQYREQLAATQVDVSRAQIRERDNQVERLRHDSAETQIVAPFEGTVSARYADPGATVRSATPIVRIISTGSLLVRFAVPETVVRSLVVGQQVQVRATDHDVSFAATVDKVAPEIDEASHMVFVEASLPPTSEPTPTSSPVSGEIVRVSLAP